MTPESFMLICRRHPTPGSGSNKVRLPMKGDADERQEERQHPHSGDQSSKDLAADPHAQCCGVVGVESDRQDEEATADISRL